LSKFKTMAKAIINLTEANEKALNRIRRHMEDNDIRCSEKNDRINQAVEWCDMFLTKLDAESIEQVLGVKVKQ
jgi:flagellin-specific chaperone FliS